MNQQTGPGTSPTEEAEAASGDARRRKLLRSRKLWGIVAGSLVVAVFAVLFGVTWFYSSEIQSGAFELDHDEDEFVLQIGAVRDSSISLIFMDPDDRPDLAGTFGVRSQNGAYGQISEITDEQRSFVTREFELMDGTFVRADFARIEPEAFPGDPQLAHGLPFSEVQYESPLGEMPAWFVEGDRDTWAVMVHGRTATREETLRALKIANDAGFPVLSIAYRNDAGLPQDPSGEYRFGTTEWEDLEAAVRYALANGARDVVLFGFSMGGGVVSNFMIESELASSAVGLVLDAPMLNLTDALNLAAEQRELPLWLPWLAANLSRVRFGTDWAALDTREEMLALELPILLIHGTDDDTIPVSQSDDFAEKAGPNVTYLRVDGAIHVGAWNAAPQAYADVMTDWLEGLNGG